MDPEMRRALSERQKLIEQRAVTLLDTAIASGEPWTERLGPKPDDPRKQVAWLAAARTIAAYRDRYQISDSQRSLGPEPEDTIVKQKIDAIRARNAFDMARELSHGREPTSQRSAPRQSAGRAL
jgi:hypothetical protein